mmetsp:Transcript_1308/g.5231  ORF Transcript_1308/g.5231 Transcript_1308/m.5231 type:complete len:302 (+) Transcript_1308:761-1666(+)
MDSATSVAMMARRSLSSSVPRAVAPSMAPTSLKSTPLVYISSSAEQNASNERALMDPSSAVAMLVCLSITRLRSVSSGSELSALVRCAVALPSPPPSPPPSARFTAATSALYLESAASTSSATLGNGLASLAVQNASAASSWYDLPAGWAPGRCCCATPSEPGSVTLFRRKPSTSCTSGLYAQKCCTPMATSAFRSKMASSGCTSAPVGASAKSEVPPRAASWSRSRASTSRATISAAPPGGARMSGTTPAVASTATSESATPPTAASTASSLAPGSFRRTNARSSRSEKHPGSSAANDRY